MMHVYKSERWHFFGLFFKIQRMLYDNENNMKPKDDQIVCRAGIHALEVDTEFDIVVENVWSWFDDISFVQLQFYTHVGIASWSFRECSRLKQCPHAFVIQTNVPGLLQFSHNFSICSFTNDISKSLYHKRCCWNNSEQSHKTLRGLSALLVSESWVKYQAFEQVIEIRICTVIEVLGEA